MLNTSRAMFIYLQRPDNGEWVTIGQHLTNPSGGMGKFKYERNYVDAGLTWEIDPVNLPLYPDDDRIAPRYNGLHDVLRDACPDSWGQKLLQREHNLPESTPMARYLLLASNTDRWGALTVGTRPAPSVAQLSYPRLHQLDLVVRELIAMNERQSAVDVRLRNRLTRLIAIGGARPKATLRDDEGQHWLVKPRIISDIVDIPRIEQFGMEWGAKSGLNFASTVHHPAGESHSAVRVLRYDRIGDRRVMCVSAASLLQAEYPGSLATADLWSYPRLADALRIIGAPLEDRHELFGRMVFNAVCGNDDDHVRNHAIIYINEQRRWRLAPAYDVVPNPFETPRRLALQLSTARFDISRPAALADSHRFGFDSREDAGSYLDTLLTSIANGFHEAVQSLEPVWQESMRSRLQQNVALLGADGQVYI